MPNKQRQSIVDILLSFSTALDYIRPTYPRHHKMVAYLSYRIARNMGLPREEINSILSAALLHDAGLSPEETETIREPGAPGSHRHGVLAYLLLRGCSLLYPSSPPNDHYLLVLAEELTRQGFTPYMAKAILFHHCTWQEAKDPTKSYIVREMMNLTDGDVPLGAFVLHLADFITTSINPSRYILHQVEEIEEKVTKARGTLFPPEVVDSFLEIAHKDYIWFELVSPHIGSLIKEFFSTPPLEVLEIEDLQLLAELMCDFLESKSLYTSIHSHGVTRTAEALSKLAGFSSEELKMMTIAGYLHDVGKFAIPVEILEKQEKLNKEEYLLVKSHAFYTYEILSELEGFETIRDWAAHHHERLDGSGYPFGLGKEELPLGARIMAIADVFSALREKRPYRGVMEREDIIKILSEQAEDGKLDEEIVSLLITHYEEIDALFLEAEFSAFSRYPKLQNAILAVLAPAR